MTETEVHRGSPICRTDKLTNYVTSR